MKAAHVYLGHKTSGEVALNQLNFIQFPDSGLATTQDLTSFAPDLASTATALSSGVKIHCGGIGLDVSKTEALESIMQKLKSGFEEAMKSAKEKTSSEEIDLL